MNERVINNVCKEVYRRFPDLTGTRPKIQLFGSEKNLTASPSPKYLLIFRGGGVTTTQRNLSYVIRVIITAQGKILKMSMSR